MRNSSQATGFVHCYHSSLQNGLLSFSSSTPRFVHFFNSIHLFVKNPGFQTTGGDETDGTPQDGPGVSDCEHLIVTYRLIQISPGLRGGETTPQHPPLCQRPVSPHQNFFTYPIPSSKNNPCPLPPCQQPSFSRLDDGIANYESAARGFKFTGVFPS